MLKFYEIFCPFISYYYLRVVKLNGNKLCWGATC